MDTNGVNQDDMKHFLLGKKKDQPQTIFATVAGLGVRSNLIIVKRSIQPPSNMMDFAGPC